MFGILKTRLQQKYRTMSFPGGPAPELPARFAGRPVIDPAASDADCRQCAAVCPTGAIAVADAGGASLDMGRCLFCRACENACSGKAVRFTREYQLAAAKREDLIVKTGQDAVLTPAKNVLAAKLYGRSLKLRQVSAGGCNACEADCNVLGTPAWDFGRFGIQFVASPRHADGLLITGPVTENMRLALKKTYDAVPTPRIVIAVGTCAVAGGPYIDHPEQHNGAASTVPVDLFVPGCPPHPLTILDGLLRFLGRIPE